MTDADHTVPAVERQLAASVDVGLAGLLASVLAGSRQSPPDADVQHTDVQHTDVQHTDVQHTDNQHTDSQHTGHQDLHRSDLGSDLGPDLGYRIPDIPHQHPTVARPAATIATVAEYSIDVPVWDVLEDAPETVPPPGPWTAFDQVQNSRGGASTLDDLPKAVSLSAPRVGMTEAQLATLVDGLERVRCRPGEDGLPPAILFFDLRSRTEMLPTGHGEAARRRIQTCVRDGDVAVKFEDNCVALLCGGLFFPGDIEVIGTRVRDLVLDTRHVLFNVDDLDIATSGAMSYPGEDAKEFLLRAVSARAHVLGAGITDVVVDYAGV